MKHKESDTMNYNPLTRNTREVECIAENGEINRRRNEKFMHEASTKWD